MAPARHFGPELFRFLEELDLPFSALGCVDTVSGINVSTEASALTRSCVISNQSEASAAQRSRPSPSASCFPISIRRTNCGSRRS